MSSEFVEHLYQALSKDRLEAYCPPNGADIAMLTNYFWNIDLIEALVPCMPSNWLSAIVSIPP